jgi:hypothetical protein
MYYTLYGKLSAKYDMNDKVKEDEMGGICSTHGGKEERVGFQ